MTWVPSSRVLRLRLLELERAARCLHQNVRNSGGWEGELGRTLGPKLQEVILEYGDLGAIEHAHYFEDAAVARSKPFTNRWHQDFMRRLWLEAGYRNELWRVIKVGNLSC